MKNQLLFVCVILLGSFALLSMTLLNSSTQEPWEVPAKYKKLKNPYADDADNENIGRMLYSKHCKSCHGTKGKGDGKKAASLDTETGDFSVAAFKDQTDGTIYYKTFFGRDDMPSFNKKITTEEDKWLVVNYVKKFK